MEYICKIFKSTENLISLVWNAKGLKLPLFETKTIPIPTGTIGYTLYFYKEDRYTPDLINVYPPQTLTEEQVKIINYNWNKCIESNLFEIEFEI